MLHEENYQSLPYRRSERQAFLLTVTRDDAVVVISEIYRKMIMEISPMIESVTLSTGMGSWTNLRCYQRLYLVYIQCFNLQTTSFTTATNLKIWISNLPKCVSSKVDLGSNLKNSFEHQCWNWRLGIDPQRSYCRWLFISCHPATIYKLFSYSLR